MDWPPFRFYIGLCLFLSTTVTFMYRTCFTLVLRAIIESPGAVKPSRTSMVVPEVMRYCWSADQQIYLLSAYFIGYIFSNLYGGVLAERRGATKTVYFILAVTVPLFASMPLVVSRGYVPTFAWRFLQGCIEGPLYPALQHLIAFWCPPGEKGRFICVFAGSSFGSLVGHGIVAVTVNNWGWPSSFYIAALIGGLVCFYWTLIVADRPDLHIRVSDAERTYIETAIGTSVHKDAKEIPFCTILQSQPVWALLVLNLGASFAQSFQYNLLPTYYNEILGFSVHEVALIFAASSLIRFITGPSFSYLGDLLLHKDYMGMTTQRKYFCIFSHIIPGVILISMCHVASHPVFSVVLDVYNNALMGSINLTVNQNSQDLSPNFASSVYGMVNFVGSIGGLATLYILALFVNLNDSLMAAWQQMFWLSAVLLLASAGVFLLCGTGKIQPWNEPRDKTKAQKEMANL